MVPDAGKEVSISTIYGMAAKGAIVLARLTGSSVIDRDVFVV